MALHNDLSYDEGHEYQGSVSVPESIATWEDTSHQQDLTYDNRFHEAAALENNHELTFWARQSDT